MSTVRKELVSQYGMGVSRCSRPSFVVVVVVVSAIETNEYCSGL